MDPGIPSSSLRPFPPSLLATSIPTSLQKHFLPETPTLHWDTGRGFFSLSCLTFWSSELTLDLLRLACRNLTSYPTPIPWGFFLWVQTGVSPALFLLPISVCPSRASPFLCVTCWPALTVPTRKPTATTLAQYPEWETATNERSINLTETSPDIYTKKQLKHHNSRCLDPRIKT